MEVIRILKERSIQPVMDNIEEDTNALSNVSDAILQAKLRLRKFFQNEYVRDLVGVIVPGTLAAILFPVFGPVVAAPAAAIAAQNGLKAFGISFSSDSIEKMLKPLEGRAIDESDVKAVLKDLLPRDKKINEEAAQALVKVVPDVKEAALTNPKLDAKWLGKSLEANLQEQGGIMAMVAPTINSLVQLDDVQLRTVIGDMLANWSLITQTITVSGEGEVSNSPQSIKGRGGNLSQNIGVADKGKVTGSSQSIDLT